jgi:hypothetical protein
MYGQIIVSREVYAHIDAHVIQAYIQTLNTRVSSVTKKAAKDRTSNDKFLLDKAKQIMKKYETNRN